MQRNFTAGIYRLHGKLTASSIVKWGYQENLKPVYFFLRKEKQLTFTLLRVCACQNLLPLLFSVCLILFCWLKFACECFCAREIFSKKINRFEIVLITTFYYTTDVYPYQPTYRASIYMHLFLFVTICENLF